jgi:hypothetical protein
MAPTRYSSVIQDSQPEPYHETFPEVVPQTVETYPEMVNSPKNEGLEWAGLAKGQPCRRFWTRKRVWTCILVIIIIGTIVGGAVGGVLGGKNSNGLAG